MITISHNRAGGISRKIIGGKAAGLIDLQKLGVNVPKWLVIPGDYLESLITTGKNQAIADGIKHLDLPGELLKEIEEYFRDVRYVAVRSSAMDEDGSAHSFAGQFESKLFVQKEQLAEKIKQVWCSAYSDRIIHYRREHKLEDGAGIAIIIQEMIDGDSSGVAFGVDPVTGEKTTVINSVFGQGEGLVSGELNADIFKIKNDTITSEVADKTHQVVYADNSEGGTVLVDLPSAKQKKPSLEKNQVKQIGQILEKAEQLLGHPQDFEFAVKGGDIYALQLRPVTTQHRSEKTDNYILWDNSNIIESYPGVTTPLTFSFITKSYESAYKLFATYLGVSEEQIKNNESVFANTLGFINGRVYYNLRSWYLMLAMVPGYSINARYMETMMGVKERFDLPPEFLLTRSQAWRSIAKLVIKMTGRFLSLPAKRRQFMAVLDKTINEYKAIPYSDLTAAELMQRYLNFEKKLLNEWKAPLLNDFFAMIWFGLLQGTCKKYNISTNVNIHNDLLCGSSDIISTQPIHRSIKLAGEISTNESLKKIFLNETETKIWQIISTDPSFTPVKKEIDRYISDFGERCVGELKLETVSYSQAPENFIRVLKNYVESDFTSAASMGRTDIELRQKAEAELNNALRFKPVKKWWLKKVLKQAREHVTARENLRYERTRAFGIVRTIFSFMGKKWQQAGIITHERDIFYLTKEEIFGYIEGRSVSQNIKALIELRKGEFEEYRRTPPPAERLATYGVVYHLNDFFNASRVDENSSDLKGIGCCPGHIRGRVRVVADPHEINSLNGDILVTSSTDPGWVTLFPAASAIIVERGSLLSHSAIVAREMGKPCIVGVTGLLRTLRTGDEIEMDGSTGKIKILNKAKDASTD